MDHTLLPDYLRPFGHLVVALAAGLAILTIGWIASKWANRILLRVARARRVDESLARFLAALAQYTVIAAATIAALGKVGVETTSVVALFASAGLAVGLALQGSLSNFASGVLLLIQRPLAIGDYVTLAGMAGTVDEIGLFATTLVSPDNDTIVIPNAQVTGGTIVNHSARGIRRSRVAVGVAYGGAPVEVVKLALARATEQVGVILRDPAPVVRFDGFGASSLDFVVFAWSRAADAIDAQDALRRAIHDELAAAKIEIPFPQMVVHRAA